MKKVKMTQRQRWFEAQFGKLPSPDATRKLQKEVETLEKVLALKKNTIEKHKEMFTLFNAHLKTHCALAKGYDF